MRTSILKIFWRRMALAFNILYLLLQNPASALVGEA